MWIVFPFHATDETITKFGEEEKKEKNEWIVWKEVASAWVETPQRFSFSTHDMPIWKKEKFDL